MSARLVHVEHVWGTVVSLHLHGARAADARDAIVAWLHEVDRTLSTFRDLVTLRSRHSWMSWRQKRHQRRVTKEERRLALLLTLVQEQHQKLALLLPLSPQQEMDLLFPPEPRAPELPVGKPTLRLAGLEERLQSSTEDDLLLGLDPQQT
jgi:hypothetical protein